MSTTQPSPRLVGRDRECQALDELLAVARGGSSGALVVGGPTGMGKTRLLDYAVESASDMRVLRVAGVASEFELQFAALHQLLRPLADRADRLPEAQRRALAAALGRVAGPVESRFLVALAVLTLLSDVSAAVPLLCVVDDAQWLDDASGQVLGFTARRLESEGIAMLFATREGEGHDTVVDGLPVLQLQGLSPAAATELLDQVVVSPLDGRVRARLVSDLEGNPLALLELVRELTAAQLSGTVPLPEALPLSERLEHALLAQVRELPTDVQRLLVLVAIDRSGDLDVLHRAAHALGLERAAFAAADTVLRSGTQITFRHSLVRTAVYDGAGEEGRRSAHLALAGALDPLVDGDRSVWHRAAASRQPDEAVAAELEASADAAKERGGFSAAAASLELAAQLTPDAAGGARRKVRAAAARLAAGELERAEALLGEAAAENLGEPEGSRSVRLHAHLALATGRGGPSAALLLDAAEAAAAFDVREARATHLQSLMLSMLIGRLGPRDGVAHAADIARGAPAVAGTEATVDDLLLDGFALLFTDGSAAAAPVLRTAVELARRRSDLDSLGVAFQAAFELWDDDALYALAAGRADTARATGALLVLPNALSQLGAFELLAGRFDAAEAYFAEEHEIAHATGRPGVLGRSDIGSLILAAWRGQEGRTRALASACARDGSARGLGSFVGFSQYALSVLELGLGNYRAAMIAAQDASIDVMLASRTLPQLVEGAVRAGEPRVAAAALETLGETTRAAGTEWALGTLARARALTAQPSEADELHREAVDRLKRCRAIPELARAFLVHGEWLRRRGRRRDAREQLGSALELFDGMGARAFARRAETELLATGAHARQRIPGTVRALTPHEWRIATLVSEGGTNAEVAAQLYLSARTVEYHLSKVYKKLGVGSRTELAHALVAAGLE